MQVTVMAIWLLIASRLISSTRINLGIRIPAPKAPRRLSNAAACITCLRVDGIKPIKPHIRKAMPKAAGISAVMFDLPSSAAARKPTNPIRMSAPAVINVFLIIRETMRYYGENARIWRCI